MAKRNLIGIILEFIEGTDRVSYYLLNERERNNAILNVLEMQLAAFKPLKGISGKLDVPLNRAKLTYLGRKVLDVMRVNNMQQLQMLDLYGNDFKVI